VIKIDPKNAHAYFNRGRADLYSGALPNAVADLNAASELSPKDPYAALWLDIVNKRSSLPSRLAEATKQIDMTKWPAPVIRLYLDQSMAEAGFPEHEPDDNTAIAHICEGDFYRAELILERGDKDKAAALFRAAAVVCPPDYVERDGAVAELRALGLTR
jgi:lipoprotein NlpI